MSTANLSTATQPGGSLSGIPNPGQMPGIGGPNSVANPGGSGHPSCHSYTGADNDVIQRFANVPPANR